MSSPDYLLAALDPQQREAVIAPRGPVVIVAGPGTGKTRTITHRIAYGVATEQTPAQKVLAVTFTRRAAGEMRTRLAALGVPGVAARTFHSAAMRQLRHFWPRLVGGPIPDVLAAPDEAMRAVLAEMGVTPDTEGRDLRGWVRSWLGEIDWAKANVLTPDAYYDSARAAKRRSPGGDLARTADVFEAYEAFKVRTGRMDLTDVVLLLAAGIEDDVAVAEEIRTAYRHLVVDEYQDVSPAQQRLLDAWLGDSQDLCVVGDPMQTIYSFAGASSQPLLDLPHRFPTAVVVRLTHCYRCHPEILALADAVTAPLRDDQARPPSPRSGRRRGPDQGAVSQRELATLAEERRSVGAQVREVLTSGSAPSEVAVLVRTRAQAAEVGSLLAASSVPTLVRDERSVLERPEALEALALLRIAARLERPDSGSAVVQMTHVLSGLGWSDDTASDAGSASLRSLVLGAIVGAARELQAANPAVTLAQTVASLERMAEDGIEPVVNAVTVATMHAAKGREWDVVLVPFLVEGIVPVSPAGVPEERRLLYVTFTRARTRLMLSWHRSGPAGPVRRSSLFPSGRPVGEQPAFIGKGR